jgi:hypothetical protein
VGPSEVAPLEECSITAGKNTLPSFQFKIAGTAVETNQGVSMVETCTSLSRGAKYLVRIQVVDHPMALICSFSVGSAHFIDELTTDPSKFAYLVEWIAFDLALVAIYYCIW